MAQFVLGVFDRIPVSTKECAGISNIYHIHHAMRYREQDVNLTSASNFNNYLAQVGLKGYAQKNGRLRESNPLPQRTGLLHYQYAKPMFLCA